MSSGRCVADEPSMFAFGTDELAEAIGDPSIVDSERLIDTARACPSGAIMVRCDEKVLYGEE